MKDRIKFTGSGEAECSCGWKSPHFAHDDDLDEACDKHEATHIESASVS